MTTPIGKKILLASSECGSGAVAVVVDAGSRFG